MIFDQLRRNKLNQLRRNKLLILHHITIANSKSQQFTTHQVSFLSQSQTTFVTTKLQQV